MVKLNNISFSNKGKRIIYDYEYTNEIAKYFNHDDKFFVEFEQDVSNIPLSLAVIPFVGNIIHISWFVGFDIEIKEIDKTFFESLKKIKEVFYDYFPSYSS